MDTITEKAVQRRGALARRDEMDANARAGAAQTIVPAIAGLPIDRQAVVSGYWPIRSELDPRPAMTHLGDAGHILALPFVVGPRTMVFRLWEPQIPLIEAGFGTLSPPDDAPEIEPDCLLVPLAAFDRTGGRIGYGAGYYDNAIARLEAAGPVLKIGLAFSVQEVDCVATEDHDRTLDYIVTETGVITCRMGAE